MQDNAPHLYEIIQGGLDKIGEYQECIGPVPAYTFVMSKFEVHMFRLFNLLLSCESKLQASLVGEESAIGSEWYQEH